MPMPSLFVETRVPSRRPSLDPTQLFASLDPFEMGPSAGSALPAPCMQSEWEDSIGKDTATCSVCGLKFPLDAESIDRHSRMCSKRHSNCKAAVADISTEAPLGSRQRSHSWSMPADG